MKDRDILIYLNSLFLNEKYFNAILDLPNLEDILYMEREDLEKIPDSNKISVEKILSSRSKDYINEMIESINKNCSQVLTILDEDYPVDLRLIERSPKVLYVKGLPLITEGIKIGVVGARKSTAYGKFAVEKFVGDLSKLGVTIISGMAQGIDAEAHKIALDNDCYTIGVLGTGVDIKFPPKNSSLYERMYKSGSIISEYPLGTPGQAFCFPERNRIISGLSDGVIVVEAKEKSGSLITARLAAEQGKEVFAVPGNINSVYSVGTNRLIRDGAIPLIETEDLGLAISELGSLIENKDEKIKYNLSDIESLLLDYIKEGYDTIDLLVEKTNEPINSISSTLTLLEMKGVIKDLGLLGFKII